MLDAILLGSQLGCPHFARRDFFSRTLRLIRP
jgi:hypothetical protein